MPSPERSIKERLAAIGMSAIMSGAPSGLPAGYDPIQPNPYQQYGWYVYGIQGPEIVRRTADIAKTAEPIGGPDAEYGPEDKEKAFQILKETYESGLHFIVLSWHSIGDTRDKHLQWWMDDVMMDPNNPYKDLVKITYIHEGQANQWAMSYEEIDRQISHLSKYHNRPYFLKNKEGKPVITNFAKESEGFINNPNYINNWVRIATKYGLYVIVEDYVGIAFNPDYRDNPDKIGSISYGDDPWVIFFSDGYKEGRNTVRVRWRYSKPGDIKIQFFSAEQLRINIGRLLGSGEEFGFFISKDEGYETTEATPEAIDVMKSALPARTLSSVFAQEEYEMHLEERARSLLHGKPIPPTPVVLIDNTDRESR